MTLHRRETEVGVRELHDRLSEYLEKVEEGAELIVTRRGKRIARLTRVEGPGPFEELERRGLIRWPKQPKTSRNPGEGTDEPVSSLIPEQRR
jgi:prevent-host-death family protein